MTLSAGCLSYLGPSKRLHDSLWAEDLAATLPCWLWWKLSPPYQWQVGTAPGPAVWEPCDFFGSVSGYLALEGSHQLLGDMGASLASTRLAAGGLDYVPTHFPKAEG